MAIKLTVENMYAGGVAERILGELKKVVENISDVNTPSKKPRKVKLEMTIKPNEQRNMAELIVSTSCTLCAPEPIETSLLLGKDPRTGEFFAEEIAPMENHLQPSFPGTNEKGKVAATVTPFTHKTASAGC